MTHSALVETGTAETAVLVVLQAVLCCDRPSPIFSVLYVPGAPRHVHERILHKDNHLVQDVWQRAVVAEAVGYLCHNTVVHTCSWW